MHHAILSNTCAVFPPKGGTMALPHPLVLLPTFNFKIYAEKHCFTTLIEHC